MMEPQERQALVVAVAVEEQIQVTVVVKVDLVQ
jgi:hypothetical protein